MALKVVSSRQQLTLFLIVLSLQSHRLIAPSRPSSMPCFSTTPSVCSQDSSRQALRQICLQNRSAYYDDVSSGLHTFVIDVFIVFLHFRQTLSSVPSVFVSFSVYCPPFISCSYFIVWLFRLQSFSWGTLALISNQTDLSLDMVIRAGCCTCYRGIYTVCAPRPKLKVLTQRAEELNSWREPATSV